MKKFLSLLLVATLLTGCGSNDEVTESPKEETKTAANTSDSGLYIEIYSQDIDEQNSESIKVFYNKVNGCLNESLHKASYRGGSSWKEVLGKDKLPICGISEQEARDMYQP